MHEGIGLFGTKVAKSITVKLNENVETETSEKGVFNSRASRMARYSAAAAGVAAVSTLDVDAAMIKVIVTDTNAQGTGSYGLDLSTIKPDTTLNLSQYVSSSSSSSSIFAAWILNQQGSVAISSGFAYLKSFADGAVVGPSWNWGADTSVSSGSSFLFGFRVNQGSSDHTNGWFKVTIDGSSSFTLNSYGYNSTFMEQPLLDRELLLESLECQTAVLASLASLSSGREPLGYVCYES